MQMKGLLWAVALCLFGLEIVCRAQDQSGGAGFISIDCGLAEGSDYRDNNTGINYTSDASFVDAGESHSLSTEYLNTSDRQLRTVRSFPDGHRNCYNLSAGGVKRNNMYLIRAIFMYGNYDSRNRIPNFDLHLGVQLWTRVELRSMTDVVRTEIIHVPSSNYLYVCLVNTGNGTPFISALEVRRMNETAYPTADNRLSLLFAYRVNYAPITPGIIIRYPDDVFERLWSPDQLPPFQNWSELRTSANGIIQNFHQPPAIVMRSALRPRNDNANLDFFLQEDPNTLFHTYLHFAEVEQLPNNQTREITIYINGRFIATVRPRYLVIDTVFDAGGTTGSTVPYNFSLVRPENSNLPPIINAIEMYRAVPFSQSQTEENDVQAIVNIQSTYGVERSNWQGDPCLPEEDLWEGLDCIVSDNRSVAPRINGLNLSSSGLTGNLSSFLSNLRSLEILDLSNNNLTGSVPDFLAELSSLRVLNLTGNNFSRPIPPRLLDRANNGLLLRIEGFEGNYCESGEGRGCKRERSNRLVIALVTSLVGSLIILAALIVLWRLRRTKKQGRKLESAPNTKDEILESKNLRFTYAQILEITNNFERVLGKGGFGTVYHGVHAGNQVAVKILSPSSVQGYREFQTEAELLTRVHHRNLTTLVGYCYEDDKMALVYEYMENGNLRELLADDHTNALSWLGRLHIALDAAQGLDYLHNGCKPPIVHRDIKSTNILLNEKLEAKLADFGLSRAFSADDGSFISTKVVGTIGYVDPEYYESQRLNEKSDIYSFGIVILELITGRPAVFKDNEDERRHLAQWVYHLVVTGDIGRIVDQKMEGDYDVNSAWKALEVAMACSSSSSSRRPTMAHVLKELSECVAAESARRQNSATSSQDFGGVNLITSDTLVGPR